MSAFITHSTGTRPKLPCRVLRSNVRIRVLTGKEPSFLTTALVLATCTADGVALEGGSQSDYRNAPSFHHMSATAEPLRRHCPHRSDRGSALLRRLKCDECAHHRIGFWQGKEANDIGVHAV